MTIREKKSIKSEYLRIRKAVLSEIKPNAESKKQVQSQIKIWNKLQDSIEFVLGGSFAKGTHIKGTSDVDVFCKFSLQANEGGKSISDQLHLVLSGCGINTKRVHGSRDYFQAKHKGVEWEFIPVLNISTASQAQNVTDVSPLHLQWLKTHSTATIRDDVRIAKQFFKAQRLYGAESYISGFSGHVVDILVAHYGSFWKLMKAMSEWDKTKYLDPSKHYMSEKEAISALNSAKKNGPLLLIDPVDKNRNAAASLSQKQFNAAKAAAQKILAFPNKSLFFKEPFTFERIAKKYSKKYTICLTCIVKIEKKDIAGAYAKKYFETIIRELKKEGVKIITFEWDFDSNNSLAQVVFICKQKKLDTYKKYLGPPTSRTQDTAHFKEIHKHHRIEVEQERTVAYKKRTVATALAAVKQIAKQQKQTTFDKIINIRYSESSSLKK